MVLQQVMDPYLVIKKITPKGYAKLVDHTVKIVLLVEAYFKDLNVTRDIHQFVMCSTANHFVPDKILEVQRVVVLIIQRSCLSRNPLILSQKIVRNFHKYCLNHLI